MIPFSEIRIGDQYASPHDGSELVYTVTWLNSFEKLVELRCNYQHPSRPATFWRPNTDPIFSRRISKGQSGLLHSMATKCQCHTHHFDSHCIQCGKPIDTKLDLLIAKLVVRLNELREKQTPVEQWVNDRRLGAINELESVIRSINEMRAAQTT